MAHPQNQNGFTWKKKKQIACITVQYKGVITMDLKVNVAAGNMWTLSTVGSEGSPSQISRRKNGGLSQEKGWNENAAIAWHNV